MKKALLHRHRFQSILIMLSLIATSCDRSKNNSRSSQDSSGAELPSVDALKDQISVELLEDTPTSFWINGVASSATSASYGQKASDYDIAVLKQPLNAKISNDPARPGMINVTPNKDFNGKDTGSIYVRSRTNNVGKVLTAEILVKSSNDAPFAGSNTIYLNESGESVDIELQGGDIDEEGLSFEIIEKPKYGTAILRDSKKLIVSYNSTPGDVKLDRFTYRLRDTSSESGVGSVVILIGMNQSNTAPSAIAQTLHVNEDEKLFIPLLHFDQENSPVKFKITTPPKNGAIEFIDQKLGTLFYIPKTDFNGADDFEFSVSDGVLWSTPAKVAIEVRPVNDRPRIASYTSSLLEEEGTGVVQFNFYDAENDPVSIRSIFPGKGFTIRNIDTTERTITVSGMKDFNGSTAFTVYFTDFFGTEVNEIVPITFKPVNDPPTTRDGFINGKEDQSSDLTIFGDDIDGDALSVSVITQPSSGTVAVTGPMTVKYTPQLNKVGTDQFECEVTDGQASARLKVFVNLEEVNDPPEISFPESMKLLEDKSAVIQATIKDPDHTSHSLVLKNQPKNGTVTFNNTAKTATYTPTANFFGTDEFSVSAFDGQAESQPFTVKVLVDPVNDAPTFASNSCALTAIEDQSNEFLIAVNDLENDQTQLKVEGIRGGSYETFSVSGNKIIFKPLPNFYSSSSTDYFSVNIKAFEVNPTKDPITGQLSYLSTYLMTCNILTQNIQDPPTTWRQDASIRRTFPGVLNLAGKDYDNDPLTFEILEQPPRVKLTQESPGSSRVIIESFEDTPEESTFSFRVSDGKDVSAPIISKVFARNNTPPSAYLTAVSTIEDTKKSISPSRDDPEDYYSLECSITVAPTKGSIVKTSGCDFTYTPNLNFFGKDTAKFRVFDGYEYSSEADIEITVTPVEDSPIARDMTVTFTPNNDVDIALDGYDPESTTTTLYANVTIKSGACTLKSINEKNVRIATPNAYSCTLNYSVRKANGMTSNIATVVMKDIFENKRPIAPNLQKTWYSSWYFRDSSWEYFSVPITGAQDPNGKTMSINSYSLVNPSSCASVSYAGLKFMLNTKTMPTFSCTYTYTIINSDGVTSKPASLTLQP